MSLHCVVCIKSVVREAPKGIGRRTPENSELNPYDRPPVEAALRLKELTGGRVTAITMGPDVGAEALAETQAMGVDEAILINDAALAGSDTLVTSRVLAAAIRRVAPFDLVLFGARTSDSDTGQVGPQTATVLEIPFLGGVKEVNQKRGQQSGAWEMKRQMDDWEELWEVNLPAAVTIHPRAFKPRPVPLIGIAQAHDPLEVQTWRLADLGLSVKEVGLEGSPTRVAQLEKLKRGRTCRMLEGEPREQVDALIAHLKTIGLMAS